MHRTALLTLLFTLLCRCASGPTYTAAAPAADAPLVLRTSTGTELRVPTAGMRRSQEGVALARQVLEVDARAKDAFQGVPNDARNAVVRELQDAAIEELAAAYAIASSTSGPLDDRKVAASTGFVDAASKVLSGGPSAANTVRTVVQTSVLGNAYLQYIPLRKYRRQQWEWQSYTSGDVLPIGAYYFRVVRPSPARPIDEFVLVFDDPTMRTIHGGD